MPGTFCSKETKINFASVFFLTPSMKASFLNVVEPSGKIPMATKRTFPDIITFLRIKSRTLTGRTRKSPVWDFFFMVVVSLLVIEPSDSLLHKAFSNVFSI